MTTNSAFRGPLIAKSLGVASLILFSFGLITPIFADHHEIKKSPPNVVVIFADDLGYGDLACFGHPTIKTPNLDKMAAEGQKWTSFYAAANVCTPSRAGLLTGRLPARTGMASTKRWVLFPDSVGGLPQSEITIAKALKKKNYATAAIGKWHLGHLPEFLPTSHGFDTYFGIPYSNDMDRLATAPRGRQAFLKPRSEYWNVPLMRDEKIIERPADQTTITKRFTEEAVFFINKNKSKPFFIYLAHNLPHVPLFTSEEFDGISRRGLYGDVIEEIDWSVGKVIEALQANRLEKNTLVVFTSDNGPWLTFNEQGGSAGLLRDGKGSCWEGGMREPTVFWGPGIVKPGIQQGLGSTLDLFPTILSLAKIRIPGDRIYDGYDLSKALRGESPSPRNEMFYYHGHELYAARVGSFKAHFKTHTAYRGQKHIKQDPPLLFNLDIDPSEKYELKSDGHEGFAAIQRAIKEHQKNMIIPPSYLTSRIK